MRGMGKMRPCAHKESGYSDAKEQSFPACAGKGMKKQLHPLIPGVLRKSAKLSLTHIFSCFMVGWFALAA